MTDAAIENDIEEIDSSSEDLRTTLQNAINEVSDRERDEQGRFATKANTEIESDAIPAETAPIETTAPVEAELVAEVPAETQTTSASKPPDSWSPAAKAKFAALDPEVQAEIVRREADVHKGFTKQDEHRNLGKTFEQAVNPYLPMIRSEGSDPVKAVNALLQTAYTFRAGTAEQKEQMLIGLMNQYQIDPNNIFNRLTGQYQVPQVDPQVAQLQQQLQQLQQTIQGGQQQSQQAEQAQISQTIESFSSDPKNLYFANVKAEMAALLDAGRAKDLQEAYDMACWARPDIRPLLLQQQEQQRKSEAVARASKARAAGSSLTGSPVGNIATGSIGSTGNLTDDIRAVYRDVMSRE